LLVDTLDIPEITNKIYDIKVSDAEDSDTGSSLHYEVNVLDAPPGYEEKKKDPSAQIFVKSFDGKSIPQ
jgi:hypothetical protein